jgi:hypothetical protein
VLAVSDQAIVAIVTMWKVDAVVAGQFERMLTGQEGASASGAQMAQHFFSVGEVPIAL